MTTFAIVPGANERAPTKRGGTTRNMEQNGADTLERYAYPIIGHGIVDAVNTGLVFNVLAPIWTLKPETANGCAGVSRPFSTGRHRRNSGGRQSRP